MEVVPSPWPTTTSSDTKLDGPNVTERVENQDMQPGDQRLRTFVQMIEPSSWRIPAERDHHPSKNDPDRPNSQTQLPHQVENVVPMPWTAPNSRDHKDGPNMSSTGINQDGSIRDRTDQLSRQAILLTSSQDSQTDSGEMQSGSNASTQIQTQEQTDTEQSGVLNPNHSRWMQGLPEIWDIVLMRVKRSSGRRSKKHEIET